MIWVLVVLLAVAAFTFAVFVLRLPRASHTILGATLLFGLAGYAWQGSPGVPAAPGRAVVAARDTGGLLVEARRSFYGDGQPPSRYLVTSDAFARRGNAGRAAGFARSAVLENERDAEAWTALGNALVELADGALTPPARHAYARGQAAAPGAPAPSFFLGLALLRAGEPQQTRALWARVLADAPAGAPWRPAMVARLAALDGMLAAQPPAMPASPPPARPE